MDQIVMDTLPRFLEALGLEEEPIGVFYTDHQPAEGFTPKPMNLPTREKEVNNYGHQNYSRQCGPRC